MSDDPDMIAAEYVLGTLDGAERATFAERLRGDDRAREAVDAWERRLADLADGVEPVKPPSRVWEGVERAVQVPTMAKMHTFKVIDGGGRGGVPAGLLASRNRWRAGALLGGLVAAALVAYIGNQRMLLNTGAAGQTYVAVVNRGGDKPALVVSVDFATHSIHVRPVTAEAPVGKSLELWYVADNKPPRSMGLVDGTRTMPMPREADVGRADTAATFAVSVEPPGGSRTGGPTGPVVYSGQLLRE